MPLNFRQYPIGPLPGDSANELDLTLDELRNSRLRLTSPLQPPEDYEARARVIPTATLRQMQAQRHARLGAAVGVVLDGRAAMVNEAIAGYLELLAPSPPKPEPTVRGGGPRERMERAFDRPRTPPTEPQVPELERRLREPGAAPAPLGPGEVAGGVSLREIVPQGVRDIAGGAVQTFIEDIGRPAGAIGGALAGEDPLDALVGIAQGWMEPGTVNWENIGFVRLLPEGSAARRIAATVASVAADPATWGVVALTGPGVLARPGVPRIIKALLEPLIPGGTKTRAVAETAFGSAMVIGTEEAAERGANPLVALGAGVLAAMGSLVAIKALSRAAVPVARGAREIGEAALAFEPLVRGEAGHLQLLPFGPDITGLEDISTAARADARAKAIEAVRAEANLRSTGVVARELKAGRPEQAAGVSGAFERARAAGLTGEELAGRARGGAAGRLRQTFAPALDVTPEQAGALIDDVSERFRLGEISQFDYLNETEALQRLVRGEGLEPAQVKVLADSLGIEDVQKLPVEQLTPRTEAQFIRETLALNEREIKATRTAERQANTQAERALQRHLKVTERVGEKAQRAGERAAERGRKQRLKEFDERIARLNAEETRAAERADTAAERKAQQSIARAERESNRLGQQYERRTEKNIARRIAGLNRQDEQEIASLRRLIERTDETALSPARAATLESQQARVELLTQAAPAETLQRRATELAAEFGAEAESAEALGETLALWEQGNRAILDNMGPEGSELIASVRATITGDVPDSWLTAALHRKMILAAGLRRHGTDESLIRKITDTFFARELELRFGDDIPENIQAMIRSTRGVAFNESLAGLATLVQQLKNTRFGLDLAIFGVQILNNVRRGILPLVAGPVNRTLAMAHLPNVRTLYSDINLPKQLQYELDGLHQGVGPSAVQTDVGSILQRFGPVGRVVDVPYMAVINKLNELQFGTILTFFRNLTYEGDLTMAAMLGRDISDPAVRLAYVDNANALTSFARTALSANRRNMERIALISPPMMRARVALIKQMADTILPSANVDQRLAGAMTIISTVGTTLAVGKWLNDQIGVGEFVMDPSLPGFGLITTSTKDKDGRNIVIDVIPQDTVERALARSIREITEGDFDEVLKAWAKVFLGSASDVARLPLAALDIGYEPGAGWRFGNLTKKGKILGLLPLPPTAQQAIVEGLDPALLAASNIGITTFPESPFALADRLIELETGRPIEELTSAERQQALAATGELERVEAQRIADLRDLAGRGDRTAQALLVSVDLRDELARIAEDVVLPDGSTDKDEYRRRAGAQKKIALGERLAFADIFESFKESDNEIERLSGRWFDLIGEATTGREVDWERFDELEAQWAMTLEPGQFDEVMVNVNAVDFRDNPLEQELQQTRTNLANSGFFDIRDQAWEQFAQGSPATRGLTEGEWREQQANRWRESLRRGGTPEELVNKQANEIVSNSDTIDAFNDFYAERFRFPWVTDHPGLAGQAVLWGYFTRPGPRNNEEEFIEAVLRDRPDAAQREIEAAQSPQEPLPEARRRGPPPDEVTAEVVRLRQEEGLSQGQIAIQTGLTTNAVRMRLRRARERGELVEAT